MKFPVILICVFLLPAWLPGLRAEGHSGLSGTGFSPVPEMSFDSLSIDIGRIEEDGEPARCVFRWKNCSGSPVSVVMVRTTCECLVPEFSTEPVAPGEESSIAFVYHQKGHPGKIDRKAFVYTGLSSSSPSAVLEVKGTVEPSTRPVWQYRYRMGPLLLRQTMVRISGNELQVERIACMNDGESGLSLSVDSSALPECFSFRCEPGVIGPGETGDIVISFDPGKVRGSLPDEIPVILQGLDTSAGDRTLKIMIGESSEEVLSAYPVKQQ